jgi:hypothetical protein
MASLMMNNTKAFTRHCQEVAVTEIEVVFDRKKTIRWSTDYGWAAEE